MSPTPISYLKHALKHPFSSKCEIDNNYLRSQASLNVISQINGAEEMLWIIIIIIIIIIVITIHFQLKNKYNNSLARARQRGGFTGKTSVKMRWDFPDYVCHSACVWVLFDSYSCSLSIWISVLIIMAICCMLTNANLTLVRKSIWHYWFEIDTVWWPQGSSCIITKKISNERK